jgi:hypothetical protein
MVLDQVFRAKDIVVVRVIVLEKEDLVEVVPDKLVNLALHLQQVRVVMEFLFQLFHHLLFLRLFHPHKEVHSLLL